MPDSVVTQWRYLYLEDLTHAITAGQVTDTVGGLGPVLLTPFVAAASDAAAASAGIPVDGIYIYTGSTPNYLKRRAT
jgi:hypothetical protein